MSKDRTMSKFLQGATLVLLLCHGLAAAQVAPTETQAKESREIPEESNGQSTAEEVDVLTGLSKEETENTARGEEAALMLHAGFIQPDVVPGIPD